MSGPPGGLPEPEDDFDAKLVDDVVAHGWHCVLVGANGEADPPYAYTVGLLHTYRHPELILVGRWQFAHGILGAAVELVQDGARLVPGDESDDVVEGYPIRIGAVAPERLTELMPYADWLYHRRPFQALQIVLPDAAGRMPDEPEYGGYPQTVLAD